MISGGEWIVKIDVDVKIQGNMKVSDDDFVSKKEAKDISINI